MAGFVVDRSSAEGVRRTVSQETRILLVEDEDTLRNVIARVLRRDGHEVVEAASAEAALADFRKTPAPLILTDILLGGMTGLDLLAKVKEIEPETVVIVMTSHATLNNATGALRSGAYDFLTKPFEDLEVIKTVVDRALDKIRLVHENRCLMERLQKHAGELETLNKVLASVANRDGLTGLYNHRYFSESIEREILRARRFGHSFSLVFMDLDHFKQFNDTHGHVAGDGLLRAVTDVVKQRCRRSDILARYGGEEFVLIMLGVDKPRAEGFAEKLRAAVADHPFEGEDHQPLGRITMSIGIASFPADASEGTHLINRADQALYEAKRCGRNRVASWPVEAVAPVGRS